MSIPENDDKSIPKARNNKKKRENRIAWRRHKVMQLYMSGITNHYHIAQQLKISRSLVTKDIQYLLEESRNEIHNVIQDKLPLMYKKTDELLNFITTEALRIYHKAQTDVQKIAALNLAKDTAQQQFELSTNSTILGEAMNFVVSHSQTLENIQKALNERNKKQKELQEEDNNDISNGIPESKESS